MFRNIVRAVAILAAVVLTGWATNWLAWHPAEIEAIKTGFSVDLSQNVGVAMMATAGLVLVLMGAIDRRWVLAGVGMVIFVIAALNGFFVLRGPAQDTSLTVKMVLVPIALLALIALAMPDFRQTSDGPQGSTNSARPKSGRVARTANRLNDWGNSLERRFRYWRQDRQYDRETRRAERAAAVPPPPPYADTDDDPFAGMPDRMPRPSLAYPVVDHSITPAAPAPGTSTTSA